MDIACGPFPRFPTKEQHLSTQNISIFHTLVIIRRRSKRKRRRKKRRRRKKKRKKRGRGKERGGRRGRGRRGGRGGRRGRKGRRRRRRRRRGGGERGRIVYSTMKKQNKICMKILICTEWFGRPPLGPQCR